jgi:hypothetical protein
MPDEPELPEAVAWGISLHPEPYAVTNDMSTVSAAHISGADIEPLYTRAQLTAHAEAVAAVRVREAMGDAGFCDGEPTCVYRDTWQPTAKEIAAARARVALAEHGGYKVEPWVERLAGMTPRGS